MRYKFWANCSLFLIRMLNISYILYLSFFKKSIQCLLLAAYLANNLQQHTHTHTHKHTHTNTQTHTHTLLENLQLFLESNYKLVPWLKTFEKIYSLSFICGSLGILTPKCNSVNSDIIIKSPGQHQHSNDSFYISYKIIFTFPLHPDVTLWFSYALHKSVPSLKHCCCLSQVHN